jgi:DnaJ-class molecular chaperone
VNQSEHSEEEFQCRSCRGKGKISVEKYNPEDVDKYYHVTWMEDEECSRCNGTGLAVTQ